MARRSAQPLDEDHLFQVRSFEYPPLPPPPSIHPDLEQASLYPQQQHASALPPVHPYGPPQYHQPVDLPPRPQQPSQTDGQGIIGEAPPRVNRLRKACDACSIRKVKCDEAGPPCRACASLEIPCTFDRPSRRRGPPNKHAEAIKRQKLNLQGNALSMPASPSPAVQNLGEMLAPVVQVQQHEQTYLISAESICPMDLLKLLIDDYFTFCHPLTPFPHEPWFRDAFAKRMDHDDRLFLALLAGMIGCLTATFPRRPRKHMRALRREDLFSSSLEFVNRCSGIVHAARGTGYLEHDGLGAYDAAVSYFLFVMHTCTYRFKAGRLYLSECVSLLRQLNLYDEEQQNQIWNPARSESSEGLVEGSVATNKVEQEMARRVFWTAFVAGRSGKTLGFSWVEPYMNPASPNAPYPPLPLKIDDRYIYEDFIEHQPQGTVSSITGFNANVSVYLTMDPLIALDSLYNTDQAHDWRKQLSILDGCLADVKQSLDNLPKELSAWLRATSHSPFMEEHGFVRREFFVSQPPQLNDQAHSITPISPQERQYITYETQKANIYASYLSVRSFFTERRGALMEAHVLSQNSTQASQQSEAQKELHAEREAIAQDLLGVLSNIRPVHIEPNSVSLFMKIRQVASPLSPVSTGENGEKLFIREDRSGEYLQRFVEMLTSLEKCGKRTPSSDGLSEDVNEEEELRRWADLAYYQKQFAQGS